MKAEAGPELKHLCDTMLCSLLPQTPQCSQPTCGFPSVRSCLARPGPALPWRTPSRCGLTSGTAAASATALPTALHSPLRGHQEVDGPLSRREPWGEKWCPASTEAGLAKACWASGGRKDGDGTQRITKVLKSYRLCGLLFLKIFFFLSSFSFCFVLF